MLNHARSNGIKEVERPNLERYELTFVHGKALHFAAVSSAKMFKGGIARMKGALVELENAGFNGLPDDDIKREGQTALERFESKLKRIRLWG